ncbi:MULTISPECIES: ABC transporter substrate-binding protein [unclassified Neorhizobium]|uniref:ABC transporter substrate-binding protein n=1 Tax=unclassified Neorhizobium TaxID=2629175 RepID=UPI001FF10446|nr:MULTISPECIES: ABC transporter substrate-binding protein [unclassified Neorhizobium]MCJ9673574.1 ABC transporter substrate-binding protein [Neorhizobium sp. SHOUNA12B]MCJ9748785.1 ABC transporter substrate-binding protein [Neorhizobium sp. SHOUNA12A]
MKYVKLLTLAAALLAFDINVTLAQQKDTVTIGVATEPPHLDPSSHVAGSIREIVYANVFQGLMLIDETGKEYPSLAQSTDVSKDGLAYTFKLHQGVVFHDGAPFDSSTVKFSLDRARGPNSVNAGKRIFEPIKTIDTPDAYTVVITLSRPVGDFLYNMGSGDAIMVSPATADTNVQRPIGTGPFKFDRWAKGDRIELSRFERYWGEPAKFSKATFRIIPDAQAQVAALQTGEVDAFPLMGAPETLKQFEKNPQFKVVVGQTQAEVYMPLNHRRKPFNDVRVRRAMTYAIDRKAVIDGAVAGYGTAIGSHFPPSDPDYLDLTGVYPYDPAKARKLLTEAGYPNGFEAKFILPPFPYTRRAGEIIQAFLADVGIKANIEVYQGPQWLSQVFRDANFDMTIIGQTEPRDIGTYARDDWYMGWKNDEFRTLVAKLEATTDTAERTRIDHRLQTIISDDAAGVYLFELPKTGVWAAKLQGLWKNSPVQANDLTKAYWAK